jgi:hypothetical protein
MCTCNPSGCVFGLENRQKERLDLVGLANPNRYTAMKTTQPLPLFTAAPSASDAPHIHLEREP